MAKHRLLIRSTMATAVVLERDLSEAARSLGPDGARWRRLLQPAVDHWTEFAEDTLGPVLRIPRHPLRMARFGLTGLQSAQNFARSHFSSRAHALSSPASRVTRSSASTSRSLQLSV